MTMLLLITRRGSALVRLARESAQRGQVAAYYKSQYSIERLYPEAAKLTSTTQAIKTVSSKDGDFNGFIPIEEIQIRYTRSTDPAAFCLKVNDVNANVEVRFHVQSAKWIPEKLKAQLLQSESHRVTKDGFLVIESAKTRSQMLNKADCLDRIRAMIRKSATKPISPTQDELELVKQRQRALRSSLLREKKPSAITMQPEGALQKPPESR